MSGSSNGDIVTAAVAAVTHALGPVVAAAAPQDVPGGWPELYRGSLGVTNAADPMQDPVFLLRVVAEHTSAFSVDDPNACRRVAGLARQRFARALSHGGLAEPGKLVESVGELLPMFGVAVPSPLTTAQGQAPRGIKPASESTDPDGLPAPEVMARWQGDLLDLSRRNLLISLGEHGVRVLVDEPDLAEVENIMADGFEIVVRGWDDLDDVDLQGLGCADLRVEGPADLNSRLRRSMLSSEGTVFADLAAAPMHQALTKLRRRAQIVNEESGASPLYLTVGALRVGDQLAPLFLIPIVIEGGRRGPWSIRMEAGSQPRLNECLVEYLRRRDGFAPGALVRPRADHAGIDVPWVIEDLRRALTRRRFPYEVVPDMRIVAVRYSTMRLWRDLRSNSAALSGNPLVHHLMQGDGPFVDPVPEPVSSHRDEYELSLPIPVDGSQLRAVRWAHEGRTFVLQGPPGTGKSQTIANILADAVASGRRALFVAEKDAALEVVQRRLAEAGLAQRCLDLRASDLTVASMREHLAQALSRHPSNAGVGSEGLRRRHRLHVDRLAAHPAALLNEEVDSSAFDGQLRARQVAAYRESAQALRQSLSEVINGVGLPDPGHDWRGSDPLSRLRRELRVANSDSVRDFLATHTDAALSVTPCVLASPSAVSQHLPASGALFDLVVFDEASQIRVEAAVGAMGRGKAVVIVGDPQQMPPSSAITADNAEEDDLQEESILLEAVRAGVPVLSLSWHYRSRSEGLVAFSNSRYYDGQLASFPTPPSEGVESGVTFRRVPGRYEKTRGSKTKMNRVEAEYVFHEIERLLGEDPRASIGVVTFNAAQCDAILDLLEDSPSPLVAEALEREREPLIVKALEHIQGDERDHILFSLTHSLDESGRLPSNFGLLSRAGGERRLNVAITRARKRNVFFASFDPTDIDRSSRVSKGPAHLREYLLAAEHGQQPVAARAAAPEPCRADLARRLRSQGLTVREDVGLSLFKVDLAVRREGRLWVAVILDTTEWAERPSVADRDDVPYTVLRDYMGWGAVHQVYRNEWQGSPEAIAETIASLAAGLPLEPKSVHSPDPPAGNPPTPGTATPTRAAAAAAAVQQQRAVQQVTESVAVGGVVVSRFRPAHEEFRGPKAVIERLPDRVCVTRVGAQWRDVAAAEGPVAIGRAATIIARRFGMSRLHPARRKMIVAAIPKDLPRTRVGGEVFIWPSDVDPQSYQGVRTSDRPHRRVHEISPEEIANAFRLALAENSGRCTQGELLRSVSMTFGFGRLGHVVQAGLVKALETRLIRPGVVNRVGEEIYAVATPSKIDSVWAHQPLVRQG
ncbi:AAA domain-containing protein [Gephyromycinifex aptenodytis]|uniref:AAA domain-containing protein n=1 Tax=Gephyromycinifex aptenodytis TaxID=2716227 RepID=UPI0014454742|nr:AAA domain-containing protein [Gephyromycinifex aptenodytis]